MPKGIGSIKPYSHKSKMKAKWFSKAKFIFRCVLSQGFSFCGIETLYFCRTLMRLLGFMCCFKVQNSRNYCNPIFTTPWKNRCTFQNHWLTSNKWKRCFPIQVLISLVWTGPKHSFHQDVFCLTFLLFISPGSFSLFNLFFTLIY